MTDFIYLNNWDREQAATRFDHALAKSGLSIRTYKTVEGELPDQTTIQNARGVFVSASVAGAYDGHAWIDALGHTLRFGATASADAGAVFWGAGAGLGLG